VILDGASTDGTLDVILEHSDRIDYFASAQDGGLYEALNKAIPLAHGDLICVLNADDWLESDAAETAVAHLQDVGLPEILLTAANFWIPSTQIPSRELVRTWYPGHLNTGCYFTCANDCHNGVYATRSAYERSGAYDAKYAIASDFKWLMMCLEADVRIASTDEITVNFVAGGVSIDRETHGVECVQVMRERFPSLTHDEASGLHHTFFCFPPATSAPAPQVDRVSFVRELLNAHADDKDFVMALAWALLTSLDRPSDTDPGSDRTLRHSVKRVLRNHPHLYRLAERLHSWILGRERVG
jgi:hypothetical protein